jgi:hypothetical protein
MALLCVCAALPGQAFANCDNMNVLSPAPGATNVSRNFFGTVELNWSAQVAAGSYDIYFGPVGSGCVAPAPHGTIAAGTTHWSPPSNEVSPGTTYEWIAVARDGGVSGCAPPPNTSCNTFTVESCPVAPTLSAPANNSTIPFGNVTFDWDAVPGATSYELFVGIDGDPLTSKGSMAGTSKSGFIEPGRTIEWKVVANAPSCPGAASAHHFFTTDCPSTPPSGDRRLVRRWAEHQLHLVAPRRGNEL